MWIYLFVSIILNVSAQTILKFGLNKLQLDTINSESIVKIISTPNIWFGALLYGGSFFVYLFALSKGEIGRLSPIAQALTIVGLVLVSIVFFHEGITVSKTIGTILLVAGAIVIFH
ncbi:hypothetical protein [Paenibacillus rhizophilus]|uniref:EamA domain-containing protein n=1 Tax=Paenibacillus rhizophilus TaxID=1850366 RepID=A0A3N9P3X3_9BACL|nr:hypothetical protein [Paenibacillus rhizophilus]RQW10127.1 hypothetical protein EH198_17025 [Paenibacillus rhizophilus]